MADQAITYVLEPGYSFPETGDVTLLLSNINKMFTQAYVKTVSGVYTQSANLYGDRSIIEDKIVLATLTGAVMAVIAESNAVGGVPVMHVIDFDGASTANYDITVTYKTKVALAMFLLRAAGTAGDTVQLKNAANAITETVKIGGAELEPVLFEFALSGGSTADYDKTIGDAVRVTDFWAYNEGTGTASDTVQLQTTANNVTNALDMSGVDQTVIRAGTINDLYRDFAAGATMRVEQVDGGGSDVPAARAYVSAYKTGGNDKRLYIAKTYDDDYISIAAAGTMRVAQTDGGGSDCPAGTALILGYRVS